MNPWIFALDALSQLFNIGQGQIGEQRQQEIQQVAVDRISPTTDQFMQNLGGGGYQDMISNIFGGGGLTPNYTAPAQIAGSFNQAIGGPQDIWAQMGMPSPGQVIGAGRQGVYDIAGGAQGQINQYTSGLGMTPSFAELEGQLQDVNTDLSAERGAALSSLAQGASGSTARAMSDVMQSRGRYSPEEMADVARYRGQQGAQTFQAAAPGVKGQFASAERGLEMQQRGQDMGLAQFAAGLKSQEMMHQAGLRAGGAQSLGLGLMGNVANLALGETAENRLYGDTAIRSRQQQVLEAEKIAAAEVGDWERVNMIEQVMKADTQSELQAIASLYGMDVNALLASLGMETAAQTGKDIFVPQINTNLLQQYMIADAAKPEGPKGGGGGGMFGFSASVSCISEDMKIMTVEGVKSMKTVKDHDWIECSDGWYEVVLKRFGNIPEDEREGRMISIEIEGGIELVCTKDHMIGDSEAGDLKVGDLIETTQGLSEVENISDHAWTPEGDLMLDGSDSYYVGGVAVKSGILAALVA